MCRQGQPQPVTAGPGGGQAAGAGERPAAPAPRLRLLDPVPSWQGRPLTGRTRDLLCLLASAGQGGASEDELADGLWPHRRPARPRQSLQVVVSRARSLLGAGAVERVAIGYRLALRADDVDYLIVVRSARLAVDAARQQELARVVAVTDTAVSEQGAQMPGRGATAGQGPHGELVGEAARLLHRLVRERALALDHLGRYAEAMVLLPALAEYDPADEPVLAALVRDEAWTSSPAAALERYEAYRRRLRESGAAPGPVLRAAHEAALSAEQPVRRGIRYASTPMVGRGADLRAVEDAVATSRLVTITGPGGVGKTRLAQAVAARSVLPVVHVLSMTEHAPRHTRWCPGGAESPSGPDVLRLARVLLAGLGAHLDAGSDPRRRLGEVLASPGTLLVLDDCEHLAPVLADLLAPLLSTMPALHVLVTSRRVLDLAGERVHRLGPLARGDAEELFRQRAAAVRPDQPLDQADLAPLLALLDGIPLAIELAAARTRAMSLAQIGQRLPGHLAVLTGSRDLPERQRTLAAVLEWSWDLLEPAARRALRRAALLADGFTLETAEAVLGPEAPVLVEALVAQSLLLVAEAAWSGVQGAQGAQRTWSGPGAQGVQDLAPGLVPAGVQELAVPRFRVLTSVRELVLSLPVDAAQDAEDRAAVRAWALGLCTPLLAVEAGRQEETSGQDGCSGDAGGSASPDSSPAVTSVMLEETGLVQELERALGAWAGSGHQPGRDLEDACVIGAALVTCWSSSWAFPQMATWGPRLYQLVVTPPPDQPGARARSRILYRLCVSTWLLGPLPERVRRAVPGGGGLDDAQGAAVRRLARTRREDWPVLALDEDVWVAWAAGRCVCTDLENQGRLETALTLTETLLDRVRTAGLPGHHLAGLELDRLRLLLEMGEYARGARECERLSQVLERSNLPQRGLHTWVVDMLSRCCRVYLHPTPQAADALLEEMASVNVPGTVRSTVRLASSEMHLLAGRRRQAALDSREALDMVVLDGAAVPGGPWELYGLALCLVVDAALTGPERRGLDPLAVRRRAFRALGRTLGPRGRAHRTCRPSPRSRRRPGCPS
ncbi:transcriptional regulator [Actinomyces lilanjuaniae]|uniref:Transcriptional regulator n=1 Tax=Actinomyces lilanjuaniae TaxID=2321394 RepID=A0ABN5PM61_9ACTO|nr:transcriptional regulator [Actinomyces lilanjuaniae]